MSNPWKEWQHQQCAQTLCFSKLIAIWIALCTYSVNSQIASSTLLYICPTDNSREEEWPFLRKTTLNDLPQPSPTVAVLGKASSQFLSALSSTPTLLLLTLSLSDRPEEWPFLLFLRIQLQLAQPCPPFANFGKACYERMIRTEPSDPAVANSLWQSFLQELHTVAIVVKSCTYNMYQSMV